MRTSTGEIDIVARRGRLIAFIEVKVRAGIAEAAESLSVRQRQRIARATEAYLARDPSLADLDVRFDAMLVTPWRLPVHLADAFRPEV